MNCQKTKTPRTDEKHDKITRAPTKEWKALHLSIIEINTDSFKEELFTSEPSSRIAPFSYIGNRIIIPSSTKLLLQNTDEAKNKKEKAHLYGDAENVAEAALFITYYIYYKGSGRTDTDHYYFMFKNLPQNIVSGKAYEDESLILSDPYNFSLLDTLHIRFPAKLNILSLNEKQEISIKHDDKIINLTGGESAELNKQTNNVLIQQRLPKPVPRGTTHTEKIEYETIDFGNILFETEIKISNNGLVKIEME